MRKKSAVVVARRGRKRTDVRGFSHHRIASQNGSVDTGKVCTWWWGIIQKTLTQRNDNLKKPWC